MCYVEQTDGSSGRAFINVVDIDSQVLDDMIASVPEKEDRSKVHFVDMKGSTVRQSFRDSSPSRHRQGKQPNNVCVLVCQFNQKLIQY